MKRITAVTALLFIWCLPVSVAEGFTPNPHNSAECDLCHADIPRFGVDTKETINFWRAEGDQPELCYRCHAPEENLHPVGVEPGPQALGTTKPMDLPLGYSEGLEGKVVCITCHFIHGADTDRALLRGFPGSQKPALFRKWQDFCRHCHGSGLQARSPHAGDQRACSFCHQAPPEKDRAVTMLPRGEALCNFCHGGIQDGHYEQAKPFNGDASCTTCHDPHLGPEHPARLKPEYYETIMNVRTINPHYRRTLCFTCHLIEEGYPLLNDDVGEVCARCHGGPEVVGDIHPLKEVNEKGSLPEGWPLKEGRLTCLTCHTAGHPDDQGRYMFLRGGPYEQRNDFCFECHDEEIFSQGNPHKEIGEGRGCELCHLERPVWGQEDIKTVKFIADINILCLRCHSGRPHPVNVNHTVSLSQEEAGKIPDKLPLDRYNRVTCATCHNPHIPAFVEYKLRLGSAGRRLCMACHRL